MINDQQSDPLTDSIMIMPLFGYNWYELFFSAGYFLEPTVFTDVSDEMSIAKEESFGPIMIISTFENG